MKMFAADVLTEYRELLERWGAAKTAEQAAQATGDRTAMYKAGWAVADAAGAVAAFEQDQAVLFLMCRRWADRHFPGWAAWSESGGLAERVADLEQAFAEAVTA